MSSGDKAQENIDQAKANAQREIEQAKAKVASGKRTLLQKLEDDGIVNPKGLAMLGFSGIFFAAIPVTSWVAQPNGLVEKAVNALCHSIAYVGSAGATSAVPQSGKIAALAGLYIAVMSPSRAPAAPRASMPATRRAATTTTRASRSPA